MTDHDPTAPAASLSPMSLTQSTKGRRRALVWLSRLLFLALVLGIWEFMTGRFIDPFWFSQPSSIGALVVEWISSGSVFIHLRATLTATLLGFALGATAGMVVGFMLGISPFAGEVFRPFLTAVYSVPRIALAPLFILWFGIGMTSKVMFSAVIVFFLVFFSTYDAVMNVGHELLDIVKVMGASRSEMLRKVLVPACLTTVFLGLRVSVPYALVGAVVGEILASNRGIGYLLSRSAGGFDTTGVFAAIFFMMLIATSLYAAVEAVQKPVLRWKKAGRNSVVGGISL